MVTSSSSYSPPAPTLFLLPPSALTAADKGVVSTLDNGDEQMKPTNLCDYMHTDWGNVGSADRNLIATFQTTFTGNKRASQDWKYGPCWFCLHKNRQAVEFGIRFWNILFLISHRMMKGKEGCAEPRHKQLIVIQPEGGWFQRCFCSLWLDTQENPWKHK